jgi:hypothetical protein
VLQSAETRMARIRSEVANASMNILLRADESRSLDQNEWIHQLSKCMRKSQLMIIKNTHDRVTIWDTYNWSESPLSKRCVAFISDINSQRTRQGMSSPLEHL